MAAATVIKTGPGLVATVNVIVAGAAGTLNDCATTGAAAVGNQIMAIPAVVGIYQIFWPVSTGIVVVPGALQVVSISYS
jgi:hypothetical protein